MEEGLFALVTIRLRFAAAAMAVAAVPLVAIDQPDLKADYRGL